MYVPRVGAAEGRAAHACAPAPGRAGPASALTIPAQSAQPTLAAGPRRWLPASASRWPIAQDAAMRPTCLASACSSQAAPLVRAQQHYEASTRRPAGLAGYPRSRSSAVWSPYEEQLLPSSLRRIGCSSAPRKRLQAGRATAASPAAADALGAADGEASSHTTPSGLLVQVCPVGTAHPLAARSTSCVHTQAICMPSA
jgi:hypothetical protein